MVAPFNMKFAKINNEREPGLISDIAQMGLKQIYGENEDED